MKQDLSCVPCNVVNDPKTLPVLLLLLLVRTVTVTMKSEKQETLDWVINTFTTWKESEQTVSRPYFLFFSLIRSITYEHCHCHHHHHHRFNRIRVGAVDKQRGRNTDDRGTSYNGTNELYKEVKGILDWDYTRDDFKKSRRLHERFTSSWNEN